MNAKIAKQIADYIFKDVFQIDSQFSLEELQEKFGDDAGDPVGTDLRESKLDRFFSRAVCRILRSFTGPFLPVHA